MSVEDRLRDIERRLAELEAHTIPAMTPRPPVGLEGEAPRMRQVVMGSAPAPRIAPATPLPPRPIITPAEPSEVELFTEKWFGQRGLLAVGVLLVLLAAGYLLKLAFERGWISPALRCAGGVVFGLGVAGLGAHTLKRGLRTYGASLIGLGFGVIYLSLWAASSLYALVPPALDIAALTFVSLSLAAVAYILDIEALCVAAAAGAVFAPILISTQKNPDGYLLYLALVAATLGGAAASKQWRRATFVVAVSFFGLGLGAAADSQVSAMRVFLFALFGGSAGLYVGLKEGWPETRFLSFAGGWALLAYADRMSTPSLIALGGMVLAAPVWQRALRWSTIWPDPAGKEPGLGGWSGGEAFYFYVTPVLLAWAIGHVAPVWFTQHSGAAFLVLGTAYAIPGLSQRRTPFTFVAAWLWAGAVLAHWSGINAVWALLGMSLSWAVMDHLLDRRDGRWYALGVGALGIVHLLAVDLPLRNVDTPAFTDSWAVSLWLCIALAAALASGLWKREQSPTEPAQSWPAAVPARLWSIAGLMLLFGVTGELIRFFRQSALPRATAELASGLSVSAWWALFAAGLIGYGFVQDKKQVRVAGLAVAGLAIGKVLLFDLSTLDALYRVASVFILGSVSLALAYLYHRYEKAKV